MSSKDFWRRPPTSLENHAAVSAGARAPLGRIQAGRFILWVTTSVAGALIVLSAHNAIGEAIPGTAPGPTKEPFTHASASNDRMDGGVARSANDSDEQDGGDDDESDASVESGHAVAAGASEQPKPAGQVGDEQADAGEDDSEDDSNSNAAAGSLDDEADSDDDSDRLKVGYQIEAALASNSVWRGVAMWAPRITPSLVASGELQVENLGRFDLSAGAWFAIPLAGIHGTSDRGGAWLVPSITGTLWLSEQMFVESGYSAYLEPSAANLAYEHDFLASLGERWGLTKRTHLTLALTGNGDPIRRRGIYAHGDATLEYEHSGWLARFAVEAGASRYWRIEPSPWSQVLMGTVSLRRDLPVRLYVLLSGVLAYSQEASVLNEPALSPAVSLAVGSH